MPNPKILSDLLKAAGKLPKGSPAAKEAVAAKIAAEEAEQAARYAPHTPPTETGRKALATAKQTLMTPEQQAKMEAELREKGKQKFLEPSVVKQRMYHGTNKDFPAFSLEHQYTGEGATHSGSGFYFTESPESASRYAMMKGIEGANVKPVYLNIKKPLHFDWDKGEVTGANIKLTNSQVKKIIESAPNIRDADYSPLTNWGDIRGKNYEKVLNEAAKAYADSSMLSALRNDFFLDDHGSWLRALNKATGYDSATTVTPTGERHYIAWFPEQVKSATGNIGTYDITTPDITKKDGGVAMAAGGRTGLITEALKAAKAALKGEAHTAARGTEAASILTKQAKEVPPPLPRAKPKTKQELSEMAERIAPQLQGEFVRGAKGTTSVAGKSRKQFDLEQRLESDLRRSREVPEAQPIDLAERKGSVMLSLPGDFTIADQDLYRVGDVTLREPSRQYGGPRFGLGHPEEASWASGLSAAGKFQRGVTEASQQYGDVPVLANYMMMGPEGINYALHFADANLKAIDATKMTKKNIRDFNSLIKRGHPKLKFPEFAGIENPDLAYQQMAADPELRKHFNSIMQMPTIAESFKMPAGLNIRHAVTEPELRDLERGMTGFSVMEMEPGVASLNVSKHPTYSHDIPGKFLGKTEVMMPYELTFPDTVAQIRANPRQAPYEFGTLQFGGGRQIIDQQLIDEIGEYRRRIKELTGKKNGGLAMADGGQAFPLQEEFQAEVERRAARPRTRAGVPVEDTNVLGGALQGLGEMLVGGGRGALATMLGAPADILNLLNVKQFGTPDIPYGSEFFKESLPLAPTTHTGKIAQQLGEFLPINPEQPVQAGVAGARRAGKALAPTMADMLEAQLQKTGMMMPIAPEGKAAKIKAPANDVGFYNPAEKAALNLQRKKGTGDAFLADMKKQPGVNDERLTELGLDQFKGRPNVTREEIIAATEERRIPLQESVKRERDEARIEELEREYDDLIDAHSEATVTGDVRARERFEREMDDNLEEQKALKSIEEAMYGPSSHPDYVMPGGTDYREIRIKLPDQSSTHYTAQNKYGATFGPFKTEAEARAVVGAEGTILPQKGSSKNEDVFTHKTHHGNEPNVLLHLRVANHVDEEGKKGLLIDELQSDWHQQGAKKGYGRQPSTFILVNPETSGAVGNFATREEAEKFLKASPRAEEFAQRGFFVFENKGKVNVPDAPFKSNWYQIGLKRAIKEAVDTGMDRVYLTTGARQADRYDLSRHIDRISLFPNEFPNKTTRPYYFVAYDRTGRRVMDDTVTPEKLQEYIGKDASKKLLDVDPDKDGVRYLTGADLSVGGEGMKQWYDKTYKNYLEKYAKQHGSKLGMTKLETGWERNEWPNFRDWFEVNYPNIEQSSALYYWDQGEKNKFVKEFLKTAQKKYEPVYYIDITDAMRESAKKGQSYKDGGAVHPAVEKFAASLPHPAVTSFVAKLATGGAAYNTIPDVSDAEKMVQGPAF